MGKQIAGAVKSAGIEFETLKGKLLVVEPLDLEKDIKTVHGVSDAVRANVYVVKSADGSKYESFEDTLIFPKVLQSQTRRKIGEIVVGRLTQGEAKRGQNPPWELATPDAKDLKAAVALVSSLSTSGAEAPEDEPTSADVPGGAADDEDGEF